MSGPRPRVLIAVTGVLAVLEVLGGPGLLGKHEGRLAPLAPYPVSARGCPYSVNWTDSPDRVSQRAEVPSHVSIVGSGQAAALANYGRLANPLNPAADTPPRVAQQGNLPPHGARKTAHPLSLELGIGLAHLLGSVTTIELCV